MRIALWDIDPFTHSKKRLSDLGWDVRFLSPAQCGTELLSGGVDVALVPSPVVLSDVTAFSVLPGVGFASRGGFPYLGLALNKRLSDIRTIRCSAGSEPFFSLATIVLREQYEINPSLVHDIEADADLVFGGANADLDAESRVDVGVEWFELTGRPLAWGFFAVRPDTPADRSVSQIQDLLLSILVAEDEEEGGDAYRRFAKSSLCVHYDQEVSEGLDELAHYLFYVGIVEDIPALRLMAMSSGSTRA